MKKKLWIGIVAFMCFSMLVGCAGAQDDKPFAEPNENALTSYAKLVSFKTDGYEQQSVEEFNARLLPEFGELLDAQAVVANAGLSVEDENYDFITLTLRASLSELYAKKMNEKAFFSGYAEIVHLSKPLNRTEKAIFEAAGPTYDFWFNVEYYLEYEISSPAMLTVAQRDNVLRAFENEFQAYVDGLSIAELSDKTIRDRLSDRAAAILEQITPDGMTIFCETRIDSSEEELMLDASFSDEDYEKLRAFQFDGYKDMRIAEFQSRVWALTDTATDYMSLLDRFTKSETFYSKKDHDETAAFYFNILQPLSAENWQLWTFSDAVTPYNAELSYRTLLEYVLTLQIVNADALTVREYNNTRIAAVKAIQDFINAKTEEELRNHDAMVKAIDDEIERIRQLLNTDAIQIDVEYSFMPLDFFEDAEDSPIDIRQNSLQTNYGTKEDYASLLALKTPDYANMTVEDFNLKLREWADEDNERMERIDADCMWNDYQVNLSDDDLSFIRLTINLSGQENGKHLQSRYTGRPESDPVYSEDLPLRFAQGANKRFAWCDLYYQFSYSITDKSAITVGERDNRIGGMIRDAQAFWSKTPLDELLEMTKQDIVSQLASVAAKYSNDVITIKITADDVHFESVDERMLAQ